MLATLPLATTIKSSTSNALYGGIYSANSGNLTTTGTLTATGVLTASAGASIGAVATSGGACLTKGMIGSDTGGSGAIFYCSSGLIWTAMGGSDTLTQVKQAEGVSAWRNMLVVRWTGNSNEREVLTYFDDNPNGTIVYSAPQIGNNWNMWCEYKISTNALASSNAVNCPPDLYPTGATIQYYPVRRHRYLTLFTAMAAVGNSRKIWPLPARSQHLV